MQWPYRPKKVLESGIESEQENRHQESNRDEERNKVGPSEVYCNSQGVQGIIPKEQSRAGVSESGRTRDDASESERRDGATEVG